MHMNDQPDASEQPGEHSRQPSTALKKDRPPSHDRSRSPDRF
jgi:hypothetical protein